MSSHNHDRNRELQQEAREWAAFTGTKYTAALRQIRSPHAQGFLGERVSARHLIAVLVEHELVGSGGGDPVLGENGFYSEGGWEFNGETDFEELALLTDMLRMFTPIEAGTKPEVGSYTLKHTAERFLAPYCPYVSNGRLIWAAAALGLDLTEPDGDRGLNLLIGVSEREHDYVSKLTGEGQGRLRAHHHRPPGLTHLQTALARCAADQPAPDRWVQPASADLEAPFHDWLTTQADRGDVVGDFASDYVASIRDSDHRIATTPAELLAILSEVSPPRDAYDAGLAAIGEWMRTSPAPAPIRTELIAHDSYDVEGYGAGAGTVEHLRYRCPCGDGEIVEEHDNIPGFREHDVRIECEKCEAEWQFAAGQPVRGWALEPV